MKSSPLIICCAMFVGISFILSPKKLAAQTDTSSPQTEFKLERLNLGTPNYHGIYISGQKSGYMVDKFERRESDGKSTIVQTAEFLVKITAMEQKTEMSLVYELEFESVSPFRMVRGKHTTSDETGEVVVAFTVADQVLNASISAAGEKRSQTIENFEFTLLELSKLQCWNLNDAKVGDVLKVNEFDASELSFDNHEYELVKIKESMANGVPVKYFETNVTSEQLGKHGSFRIDQDGMIISSLIGGIFETRKEPKQSAMDIDFSTDLFVLGALRVNKGIGDPTEIESLELKVKKELTDMLYSGPYQAFELRDDMYVLKLGKRYGKPSIATAIDIEQNLEETVELPINHPTIQKMTAAAIGNETDPEKKVRRLIRYVSEYVEGSYTANALSVLEICRNKSGDCSEHALLFTTMARAAGIPCREAMGFVYMGDEQKAFGAHAWNEVILDGHWWPVDPTWNEFEINPTHIQIEPTSQVQMLGLSFRMRLLNLETK